MEKNNLSVQSNLYASDAMADMFNMDIFSNVTTDFGFGELFPQLSEWSAPDFSWTTEEKRQKTNDSYADFDCCINPPTPQVMEPITPKMSSTPAIQEGVLHCAEEVAAERSSETMTVIEQSNGFKKEGLLSMSNNQPIPRREKSRKRIHRDLVAEENMAVYNNTRISPDINVQEFHQKPIFPYSCLIAMALRNSADGALLVSQIYDFICENFHYYKTAPSGWKNCIRHALSINKNFIKRECASEGKQIRFVWSLDPTKAHKMDKLICEWSRKGAMVNKNETVHPVILPPNTDDEMKHLADIESIVTTKDLSAESQTLSAVVSPPEQHHHFDIKYTIHPNDLYQAWLFKTSARLPSQ